MTTKTCPQCGKEFEVGKYISVTAYCSQKCQRTYNAKKRNAKQSAEQQYVDEFLISARSN